MTKLFPFLKPYRLPMIVAVFLMLIELAVELAQPILIAKIIDDGIIGKDLNMILTWGAIMLAASLAAFLSGITNSFVAAYASQNFGYDVRKSLFSKVQSFSFANFSMLPASSLITRMTNDVNLLQNTLFMSLRIAARAPLLVVFGTLMAFLVNVQLSFALALIIPPLLIFLLFLLNKAAKLFSTVQGKLDSVNSVMRENLAGMRLIKAFSRGKYQVTRFNHANDELRDETSFALRVTETTIPVLMFFMNLSILVILWFGNVQVQTGSINVGEVVAIVNYAARITTAFSMFSFIIMVFSRAKASAGRIVDVLDVNVDLVDTQESQLTEKLDIETGKVEFKNVTFAYPSAKMPTLKDISFTIDPGQMIAILGATGAGKTSLFQLIPRLYDVSSGSVTIDNHDVKEYKLETLRSQIGFVPQEAILFTGTIKDNVSWGKEGASLEEIKDACKDAQIHDTIRGLPDQYNTRIGQKGVNLSGGQKQRLSIARAFVRKPKLLMLDDSTSALDLKTEAKLLQEIKKYQATTLIITQKISTAKEADKILLLENGVLIAEGDHNFMLKNSPLYQQIYESQFGGAKVKC